MRNDETYFIIYPRGERNKLCVTGLTSSMMYEKSDYAVASRKEFSDEADAIKYAKELADAHSLTYEGNGDGFLD